ncbi:MAG: hypothetical protein GY725_19080 [bacterium]|nr:hypothetical protein [bacterium]
MRNYALGILTGIFGTTMYFAEPGPAWYLWILFVAGAALVAFSLDVFVGSLEENQPRAAWMGLSMFGGPGVVLLLIVLKAGF